MSAVEKLDDTASLFEPGGLLSAAALDEMRANPGFPAALRTLSTGMLALYRGNRLLNVLINDRGRMVIGYLALYLNERGAPDGRGGFGIGQLKALCAAAGVASPRAHHRHAGADADVGSHRVGFRAGGPASSHPGADRETARRAS